MTRSMARRRKRRRSPSTSSRCAPKSRSPAAIPSPASLLAALLLCAGCRGCGGDDVDPTGPDGRLAVPPFPPSGPWIPDDLERLPAAFECAGDQALPAATPGDTAGLWGRADEAWIAGNLARAVEILDGLQVPDRHRHPLLTLGSILEEGFGG